MITPLLRYILQRKRYNDYQRNILLSYNQFIIQSNKFSYFQKFNAFFHNFQISEQKFVFIFESIRGKRGQSSVKQEQFSQSHKIASFILLGVLSFLGYSFLKIQQYKCQLKYEKYYEDKEKQLKEHFIAYLKPQLTKHVWHSQSIVEETVNSIENLCEKPSIQSKTSFGLSKVARMKKVENDTFRLSKGFLRKNFLYKENTTEKSIKLTISSIQKPETLLLLNNLALNFFQSDEGQRQFTINLYNSFLSEVVKNSFTNAVRNSLYSNLDSKSNIEGIRKQFN